jgi:hypothetical protein
LRLILDTYRLGQLPTGGRIVRDFGRCSYSRPVRRPRSESVHGLLAGGFTIGHGDPFDRLLAAQAIIEEARLVTADPAMQAFGADLLW